MLFIAIQSSFAMQQAVSSSLLSVPFLKTLISGLIEQDDQTIKNLENELTDEVKEQIKKAFLALPIKEKNAKFIDVLLNYVPISRFSKKLLGHRSDVSIVRFSSDSTILASGSFDNTIRLWNTKTNECIHTLQGHTDIVWSVNFNPESTILVSGSQDNLIKLWCLTTGRCVNTLCGHDGAVYVVTFSPSGIQLASGSQDKSIRLWDSVTGACNKILCDEDKIFDIFFNLDESILTSVSFETLVKLWDINTGTCTQTVLNNNNMAYGVSSNGMMLANSKKVTDEESPKKFIELWDLESKQCVKKLPGGSVASVGFNSDATVMAIGFWDKEIKLYDIEAGTCIKKLSGHKKGVLSIGISPDNQTIASGSGDRSIRVCNIALLFDMRSKLPYLPLTTLVRLHKKCRYMKHIDIVSIVEKGYSGT